ncbi:putative disease resistance protein RGA1 isoform X2 [Prunus avium]|uniref:Disease resistance protein RGA1 isoform X2 n=1 Tax=Prunus avium TaxID=42229 RepID=A0A6P5T967_PRUAV|nr:putative disease resistance protein RGA1 isoform X2 [Prunus avium]
MVEGVLTFAAEGVLMKLSSLAAQEITLSWGFKGELNRLRRTLSTIEGYLGDVTDQPQDRGDSIEDWVKNLKGIAQDADDVLDEINYELLRHKVELQNHIKKKVLNFFSLSNNPIAFRLKMAHKIQKINASLEDLKSEASVIGLVSKRIDAAPQGTRGRIQTDSLPENDGIIFGRDKVVSDIVTTLTNSNINQENLSVMAIVGMPGLGKTTLAKSVYNDNSIKGYFEKRIWVSVSDPFNINVILICMLESLNPTKATVRENLDALLTYLQEELKEKRYLLVLDDVWNEDSRQWNRLMSYLERLNYAPGSKIIVTTRSARVASISEKLLLRHNLSTLSTDECWSILKDRAFLDGSARMDPDLERIGKQIAEKCAGVPLVAKVLGGILRSKNSIAEWSSIKESRIWDLAEEEDRIIPILKLSFDNLTSPSLKQCFAYCSMLRKDVEIETDNLIQLWMAQGLLHPSRDKSEEMEDVGYEYFDILLQSSLFQDATANEYGIISKCKMHDLVHDLAELVSKSESLIEDNSSYTLEIQHVARVSTSMQERIRDSWVGRLRSLFSDGELPSNMLPGFKTLRVLNLFKANIAELPTSIGKLKHLRYLDISETRLKTLPSSIGKLYNLQTLRARHCAFKEFPKEVQTLINLRHVYCDKRMKFPRGILGKLTSLRTLPPFYVDKERGCEIQELAALNQLKGQLVIYNLEHVRDEDEARKAKLKEKKNVRHLIFLWTENRSTTNNYEEDVLEGLQPHPKLEILAIVHFMGAKFSSWMMNRSSQLDNLKKIVFHGCHKCEEIPALGCLPHLTLVWIYAMDNLKCVGLDYCTSLQELWIWDCGNLTSIRITHGMALTSLRELEIGYCNEISSLPALQQCRSLQKLEVGSSQLETLILRGWPKLKSLPQQIQNFTSLTYLSIQCFHGVEALPEWLGNLTSLTKLEILNFKNMMYLPSVTAIQRLTKLKTLELCGCPLLQSKEWPKISHIQHIDGFNQHWLYYGLLLKPS